MFQFAADLVKDDFERRGHLLCRVSTVGDFVMGLANVVDVNLMECLMKDEDWMMYKSNSGQPTGTMPKIRRFQVQRRHVRSK